MIVNQKSLYSIKLLLDLVFLNVAFLFSAWIAQPSYILYQRPYMFILMLGLNVLWYFTTRATDFYSSFNPGEFDFQSRIIFKNVFVQIIAAIFFIFAKKENLFTRNFIILYFVLLFTFINFRTLIFGSIQSRVYKSGRYVRNLIVVGANKIGKDFVKLIESNQNLGYNFIGYVDDNPEMKNEKFIGTINELDDFLQKQKVDEAVVTTTGIDSTKLSIVINICNKNALRVHIIPDYFQFLSQKFSISSVSGFPIITVRNEPLAEIQWRFLKRTFDIFFSLLVSIFILSWLVPLIAIMIKLTSRGSVFFVQDRVGLKNEKFRCYKFRSMYAGDKSSENNFRPTTKDDPRITGIGRFLRKSNLDEIPQFWNVLKGDMSIVGPRPHPFAFNQEYLRYFEAIKLRHLVKPGLTGWAQIHGLRGDVADTEEHKKRTIARINHDIWYIENWGIWLDIQIIFTTVWQMIAGKTKAY